MKKNVTEIQDVEKKILNFYLDTSQLNFQIWYEIQAY